MLSTQDYRSREHYDVIELICTTESWRKCQNAAIGPENGALPEGLGAAGAHRGTLPHVVDRARAHPSLRLARPRESTAHEFLRGLVQLLTVVSDTCD